MIRVLILLLLVVGLSLLAIQNGALQALVAFGYQTPALPVAVWMLCAIAAGILTSAILQLLNYRPAPASARSPLREPDVPPRNRDMGESRVREPFPEDLPRTPESERVRDRPRSPQTPPRAGVVSDWETPASPDDDWGVETPRPRPNLQKEPRTETSGSTRERPRSDSVDRPSDREDKQPEGDRVYDANYRVINPPVAEEFPEPEISNEEDWGFDDEEFESEYRRQYRDREG